MVSCHSHISQAMLLSVMYSFHRSRLSYDPHIWLTLPGMRKESSMAIYGLICGRHTPPILIGDYKFKSSVLDGGSKYQTDLISPDHFHN